MVRAVILAADFSIEMKWSRCGSGRIGRRKSRQEITREWARDIAGTGIRKLARDPSSKPGAD